MDRKISFIMLNAFLAGNILAATAAPATNENPASSERPRGLITDRGWLMFAGGISPWASLKADRPPVSVPDMSNSGKDFTFEFRFMHPLVKDGLFAIGYSFHFFTFANASNNSATALKSSTDITGTVNPITQALSSNTFSTSSFGPSLILTYRFPLARYFAVSERTYPYAGAGGGVYFSDLTVQPLTNISTKYQAQGYALMARVLLGFAVDLGMNVGAFFELQFAPAFYQSSGYTLQGMMHSVMAGFSYAFDEVVSR